MWRALLATLAPLLAMGGVEAGLRLCGYGQPTAFLIRAEGRDTYTTNERYGWRFFPRALARTPVPTVLSLEKPAGTYRVFVLGESAAMGMPDPAFSFARILEALLRERYPRVRFEVVNAAMTAINSHVIVDIARDCARFHPDLFLIFMGNNEVVGPYGAGTVFGGFQPSLPIIRAGMLLEATRTGQFGSNLVGAFGQPAGPREWGGMAMFLQQRVAADDPRMEAVYSNFKRNLEDILKVARQSGASAMVATVPVNLKDCPPFASVHHAGLEPASESAWKRAFEAGSAAEQAGDLAGASREFASALRIDDHYAELHFRYARCLERSGDAARARAEYQMACDLDALRFRADSRINAVIRATAGPAQLDAERLFETSSVPGKVLFFEHVHMTFEGNYLLARAYFDALTPRLPAWVTAKAEPGPLAAPDAATAAESIGFTPWHRARLFAAMSATMDQPPFTNQAGFAEEQGLRHQRLEQLQAQASGPAALTAALTLYQERIRRFPEDLFFRAGLAELLRASGKHLEAAAEWRFLLDRSPGLKVWRTSLGSALTGAGHFEEAAAEFRRVLKQDPDYDLARFGMGLTLERQGRLAESVVEFEHVLRISPRYAEAHSNLASVLARLGQTAESVRHYREAVAIRPDFAEARFQLAGMLAATGHFEESAAELEAVLRARPAFAEAHHALGLVLNRLGRPAGQAISHFQEALRIRPEFAEAHNSLGAALARGGRRAEAIAHFRRALELKAGFAEAQRNLATAIGAPPR